MCLYACEKYSTNGAILRERYVVVCGDQDKVEYIHATLQSEVIPSNFRKQVDRYFVFVVPLVFKSNSSLKLTVTAEALFL